MTHTGPHKTVEGGYVECSECESGLGRALAELDWLEGWMGHQVFEDGSDGFDHLIPIRRALEPDRPRYVSTSLGGEAGNKPPPPPPPDRG